MAVDQPPARPPILLALALVAAGGAVGACARYAVTAAWPHEADALPAGTLVANLVGCLAMGVFLGYVSLRPQTPEHLALLVATGFLGGLTTFSSFAADGIALGEDRALGIDFLYVSATLVFGWLLLRTGWVIARRGAAPGSGRIDLQPQDLGE